MALFLSSKRCWSSRQCRGDDNIILIFDKITIDNNIPFMTFDQVIPIVFEFPPHSSFIQSCLLRISY